MAGTTTGAAQREPPVARPHMVFVSSSDPLDVRSFSGVLFYVVQALRAEYPDIEVIRQSRPRWFGRLQKLARLLSKGRSDPYYWTPLNRWFASRLVARWRGRRVLVIGMVNSTLMAELAPRLSVINISDATFHLMRNFYETFERIDDAGARAGERAERETIRNAVHNSYSSPWAARSAIEHYGAPPEAVSTISWGCNLPFIELGAEEAWEADGCCRLLFIGGDWQRKGGDLVLETAHTLRARGFPFHLDLVGASPADADAGPGDITAHGFLSKGDPVQFDRLKDLYRRAGFLFLPTRQDCTPMVFAEANAYGTPGMTRDVGGVGGVVEDGVNGHLLPSAATPADFADAIERSWRDTAAYRQLRADSRRAYEERLNWTAWARRLRQVIDGLPV